MYNKSFKFRLYPNQLDKEFFSKNFGCCRFLWNYSVNICNKLYKELNTSKVEIKIIRATIRNKLFEIAKDLKNMKKGDYVWLGEIYSDTLGYVMQDLQETYRQFLLGKKGQPRFKSKKNCKNSFKVRRTCKLNPEGLILPKYNGIINCIQHRQSQGEVKFMVVSMNAQGQYFVAICCEIDNEMPVKPLVTKEKSLGIDLGLKDFLICSNGLKIKNQRYLQKSLKKIKRFSRAFSRKVKGGKNWLKLKKKISMLHLKIKNQRLDYTHKVSKMLVDLDNYNTFCIENLNVKGMMKNSRLAKAVSDVGWYNFTSKLSYKCDWYGKNLLECGRFEPSSKTCNICGVINDNLKLSDRIWNCEGCGKELDRDINAAKNIRDFAIQSDKTKKTSKGKKIEAGKFKKLIKQYKNKQTMFNEMKKNKSLSTCCSIKTA